MSGSASASFNPENLVALGRITRTQGHHGAVRLQPLFEPLSEFEKLPTDELILKVAPEFAGPGFTGYTIFHIESFSFHQQYVVLELAEVPDMTAAERLRNAEVYVREELMWKPDEGDFFAHEIVGFDIVEENGTDVGSVLRVEPGPAHDFLLVRSDKHQFLIPMVKQVIKAVRMEDRKIVVELPPGLDEV